jgi:hypothetical protein
MPPNSPDPVRPGPARLRAPHPRQQLNTERLRRKTQRSRQDQPWDDPDRWEPAAELETEGGADNG